MKPIRLRKEFIKGYEVLDVAQNILGQPISYAEEVQFDRQYRNADWTFYDNASVQNLTICKRWYADGLDINLRKEYFGNNNTVSFNIKNYQPNLNSKLDELANCVSKPWSDWTDEEIISDPMWIYYFQSENRSIPEQYHNAMVLFSYQMPSNQWVKRYFNAKDKKSTQDQANPR